MDASIWTDNGTLMIDFRKPQKSALYRDVEIETSGHDTIHVTAKKANFDLQMGMWGEKFDLYSEDNMARVLPEYIEEYTRPALSWWERPVGDMFKKGGGEWASEKRMMRIKPGFFEYKNTNKSVSFTTTKYIIYHK